MLTDYWHIACSAKDINKKPKAVTLFSKHIAVFRDEAGQASAIEDRCAHRNMPLHCGKVIKGELECPYHGWRYNGQGGAISIPTTPSNTDCPEIAVESYLCYEQDGYVWVCMSNKPAQKEPPRFEFINDKAWTTFRMQTKFKATVENCLENFLDVPHAAFVHKFWFRATNPKLVHAEVAELPDGAIAEYFSESREKSLVFGFLSNSKTSLKHTDRYIAPSMSKVDYHFTDNRHYVISSFCSPQTDTSSNVFTVISFKYGRFSTLIRCLFEPVSRIIIRQDVKTLEKQQANINKFGGEQFSWIKQDLLRPSIVRWRKCMSEGRAYEYKKQVKKIDLHI